MGVQKICTIKPLVEKEVTMSGMSVVAPSGAKVYNITAGKTLPDWLTGKNKKKLRKDNDFNQRIQLLQDFEFNGACQQVRVSPDGHYVAAVGTYPPRLKIYTVEELSMKCERGMDPQVVSFSFLSDDYRKLALLQADRHIELHAQYGTHHRIRLPKFGRAMIYDASTAQLCTAAAGSDIYRLDLQSGCFRESFRSTSQEGNNCIAQHPDHLLIASGGDSGIVECFDVRQVDRVGHLNLAKSVGAGAITSVAFDPRDTMRLAVGTEGGVVMLYDIRSSQPVLVKDHQYELPVHGVQFHGDFCVSTDARICKIWDKHTGYAHANIESENNINHATLIPDSGLMFLGQQKDKVDIYYLPGLGAAPFWCSFLDNLTEELEQSEDTVIYDDYKFITRQELESFGLHKLIGTPYLRAYMHGFFMDARLYRKVFDMADPYGYKEYVQDRIKKKREEQQASRITKRSKAPKVNRHFHERYLQDLKGDDRFGDLMKKSDFEIDPNDKAYQKPPAPSSSHDPEDLDDDQDNWNGQEEEEARPSQTQWKKSAAQKSRMSTPVKQDRRFVKDLKAPKQKMDKREKSLRVSLSSRVQSAKEHQNNRDSRVGRRGPSRNMEFSFVPESSK